MEKIDIETIKEELGSCEEPFGYFSRLYNKIFSYKENYLLKIFLMEELCTKKLPDILDKLDKNMSDDLFSKINFIWKQMLKEVEEAPNDSPNKRQALMYLKWSGYIYNYNINLKNIKYMLIKCQELIDNNILKWLNFAKSSRSDIHTTIIELNECESQEKLITCTFLRRILEIIFNLQILNNKDSVKNKFNPRGLFSYYNFLKKENIEWKIRTLIKYNDEINSKHYKYAISKIWKSKNYITNKIYKKLLSSNIHHKSQNFIFFSCTNRVEYIDKIFDFSKRKLEELDELKNFVFELDKTLKNHIVSFEKGELIAIVRDYKIDEQNLNEIFFNFDKDYKLEEIPNED